MRFQHLCHSDTSTLFNKRMCTMHWCLRLIRISILLLEWSSIVYSLLGIKPIEFTATTFIPVYKMNSVCLHFVAMGLMKSKLWIREQWNTIHFVKSFGIWCTVMAEYATQMLMVNNRRRSKKKKKWWQTIRSSEPLSFWHFVCSSPSTSCSLRKYWRENEWSTTWYETGSKYIFFFDQLLTTFW